MQLAEQRTCTDMASLIYSGAQINARDCCGRTVLMHAAFGGYASIVDTLIMRGANVHVVDCCNFDVLDCALLGNGMKSIVQMQDDGTVQSVMCFRDDRFKQIIDNLMLSLHFTKNAVLRRNIEVERKNTR